MYPPLGIGLLVAAAADYGVEPTQVLAGTSLTPADLAEPSCLVAPEQDIAVARNLIAALGDRPGLGVEAGRKASLAGSGIAGFAMLHSPTWRAALEMFPRFQPLMPMQTVPRLSGVEVVFDDTALPVDVRDLLAERDLASIGTVMAFVGGPQPALEFRTRFVGARAEALAEVYRPLPTLAGCPAHAFRVDTALLDAPLPTASAAVQELCIRECERLLNEKIGTAARVRHRLLRDPRRMPSLEEIAAEFNLDPRTLRRQLTAQGTSYRALREEVLCALAVEYLTRTGLNVTETAARLGYSSPAAFSQAFTRWTGSPPSRA